ncbi:helix-turn-helix domain-containing protein [Microlunatus elymi]|uniref:helix-turn-helix domain-containing protein n=1 Tax=Microlunatus elymi TaxID=2596828 RepID=UPI001D1967DC|nr:helix-turn-helix transcriptional regulator [Microlunatus elymi]
MRDLFGAVIRQARHDQERTLADVAGDAGVSVPYLSEMERGRKEPSSEMLAAVTRALGLDLLELVSKTYVELLRRQVDQPTAAPPRSVDHRRRAMSRSGEVLALAA